MLDFVQPQLARRRAFGFGGQARRNRSREIEHAYGALDSGRCEGRCVSSTCFQLTGRRCACGDRAGARKSETMGLDSRGRSRGVLARVCACPGSRGASNARAGKCGAPAPELRPKRVCEHVPRSSQTKHSGGEKGGDLLGSEERADILKLKDLRDGLEHVKPQGWSLGVGGLHSNRRERR